MIRSWLILLVALSWTLPVPAQTSDCETLTGGDRKLAESLMATEYLYDCCDETIVSCLEAEPVCDLAVRLADNICRRVGEGQDEARIRRGLSRRARSMVGGGSPAAIDLSSAPTVGPETAPVTVVIYACARCPYCSKLVPQLYRAVLEDPLEGHVRLAFRVFPIRGHEGSTPAGLGLAAADRMGVFWRFMLESYGHFDEFTPAEQLVWAESVGLDPRAFEEALSDPTTRELVVASKKEGLVNGVEATPTLFINGRRWVGDLEIDELIDAIAEEVERTDQD